MQFPAELTDIGDAQREHRTAGNPDPLCLGKGKRAVAQVGPELAINIQWPPSGAFTLIAGTQFTHQAKHTTADNRNTGHFNDGEQHLAAILLP